MKKLTAETYMSWENETTVWNPEKQVYEKETVRAIALCDQTGYFVQAINCMRDGDMGEKDENGVYQRIWYGDYIDCYGNERATLRPATPEEVELYKQYCSYRSTSTEKPIGEVRMADATHVIWQSRGWLSRHLLKVQDWFRRIQVDIRVKLVLAKSAWRHRHDKPGTFDADKARRSFEEMLSRDLKQEP